MNPEYGVFGVAKDTNETTNPNALASIDEGTDGDLHQRRLQPDHRRGLVGGQDQEAAGRRARLARLDGLAHRRPQGATTPRRGPTPTAASPRRSPTSPTSRPTTTSPLGVPIDAIIFGGRTSDREPLIRAITDLAEGVYDGLTLGAEATFAAEGVEGQLRYDPMSNRPFMAYGEGDYAAHYLDIVGAAKEQPIFAHVNWFQRDPEDGHFLWPGYRDNLRPLLWLLQLKNGEVEGRRTAVGIIPTEEELDLDGHGHPGRRPRAHPHHRQGALAAGDGLPRGAPSAVRPDARGDLGGPPPRRRRPRRRGLSRADRAVPWCACRSKGPHSCVRPLRSVRGSDPGHNPVIDPICARIHKR